MTRTEIIEQLQNNIVEVTFTKVNGEQRIMPCTLMADLLPAQPVTENKKTKAVNEAVVSAYALESSGWRSFRVDSVTNLRVLEVLADED